MEFVTVVGGVVVLFGIWKVHLALTEIAETIKVQRNPTLRYSIYQDRKGEWRWRATARNGEIIGVSAEGYTRKSSCQHSINLMQGTQESKK